ncbi:ABC transporter permease [Granulicella sp. dw_53]|uniref:ABC transporter permease n=1 Tax=Granulicella sp. dw_53 TaxID=2719792 RepID=UPI001BD6CF51|nr:ABC transporter permease [Granulicella sp. dw_53]
MFLRLLWESFVRQRRRKLLAGIAILFGTTAVTAMLALATTIGDRIHKELAVYGANIVVYPKAEQLAVKVGGVDIKPATGNAYLKESDLSKLKTIFWANNINGISPELPLQLKHVFPDGTTPISAVGLWFHHPLGSGAATITTGASELHPSWKLNGSWPTSKEEAVIGSSLSNRLNLRTGDNLPVIAANTQNLHITGTVSTGDENDEKLLLPLATAQFLNNTPDAVSRVEVSARTKPEDSFARTDPDTLSPKQREIWYCRPYANSISYQIREVIPGAAAEQIRKVEQTEGTVLARISGLMWLISIAALLAASFAVSAAMATAILERRGEIGLMRSLGASKASIALLFYAESGLLALFAGVLGYLFGSGLAAWLGAHIFAGSGVPAIAVSTLPATSIFIPVLLPVVVATALIVAIAGSTPSIRSALKMDPSSVLRANA